jgi:hypothetical protein
MIHDFEVFKVTKIFDINLNYMAGTKHLKTFAFKITSIVDGFEYDYKFNFNLDSDNNLTWLQICQFDFYKQDMRSWIPLIKDDDNQHIRIDDNLPISTLEIYGCLVKHFYKFIEKLMIRGIIDAS